MCAACAVVSFVRGAHGRQSKEYEHFMGQTILVTGAAGFIGMHTAERLLARGDTVVGLDNLNAYYDQNLKEARLAYVINCDDLKKAIGLLAAGLKAYPGYTGA